MSDVYTEVARAELAEVSRKYASIDARPVEQFCTARWLWMALNQCDLSVVGMQPSGRTPGGPPGQTTRVFPRDFLKRGRSEKQNNMDWNAIIFAVALPIFVFGAIGLGVYAQRLLR